MDGHIQFFRDVHDGQIDGLLDGQVVSELDLALGVFPDAAVEVFDGVGSVDDLPDLEWIVEVAGQIRPIVLPGCVGMAVLRSLLLLEDMEGLLGSLPVGSGVDLFEVGAESLPVSANEVLADVSDLVDDAELRDGFRGDALDGVGEALEIVRAGDQYVLHAPGLQVCEDAHPEVGRLAIGDPHTQDLLESVLPQADDDVDALVGVTPVVFDLQHDAVHPHGEVHGLQGSLLPQFDMLDDEVGHVADGTLADVYAIDLLDLHAYLGSGHSPGVHADDALFQLVAHELDLGTS